MTTTADLISSLTEDELYTQIRDIAGDLWLDADRLVFQRTQPATIDFCYPETFVGTDGDDEWVLAHDDQRLTGYARICEVRMISDYAEQLILGRGHDRLYFEGHGHYALYL
jgi:hypothetical protein